MKILIYIWFVLQYMKPVQKKSSHKYYMAGYFVQSERHTILNITMCYIIVIENNFTHMTFNF